jgi:hypothetical protein
VQLKIFEPTNFYFFNIFLEDQIKGNRRALCNKSDENERAGQSVCEKERQRGPHICAICTRLRDICKFGYPCMCVCVCAG